MSTALEQLSELLFCLATEDGGLEAEMLGNYAGVLSVMNILSNQPGPPLPFLFGYIRPVPNSISP